MQLIEWRSQVGVGPGTIAGRDHREGAAGHHNPLDIVLLPTSVFEGWRGGVKDDKRRRGRRTQRNDGGQKRRGKRKQQIGRSEGRRGLNDVRKDMKETNHR